MGLTLDERDLELEIWSLPVVDDVFFGNAGLEGASYVNMPALEPGIRLLMEG